TNLQKVMIIGGGKTGFYLAEKLSEFGAAVKLVEKSKARCHYLSTHLNNVMVLHSDGTDISLLEEENMNEMDAFVTATGYDEENLLLALTAKQHGIADVISKVSHESYKGLIERMGVDVVLNPLDITASNILRFIQGSKKIISSLLIQGQAEIMEIIAHSHMTMIGVPLAELELPDGVLIAAIHRGQDVIIPSGKTKIELHDKVIILSLLSEIGDLEKLLKNKN
ncbi:NAD-binding protein, partial [Emergencia timonensis]